jgi:hypothetical protein
VSDTTNGKRIGRPPKDENERRVPLSLRIVPELRNELEAAAEEENRSLTQLSEFALARFLDARKLGDALLAEAHSRPARPGRSLKHRRGPVDMLGRAFGREVTGLLLLIGCLVKEILYDSECKKIEGAGLADPEVSRRVSDLTAALLRLVGPDEDPALVARIRQSFWHIGPTDALHPVAEVAMELAYDEGDCQPWAPIIRDLLGEAVVARIRRRLPGDEPTEAPREHG